LDNINKPNNQNPGSNLPKDTPTTPEASKNSPANTKSKDKKKDKKKDEHVQKMLPSMVSYEKKRKQKKIILAVLGVSFVGVSMLSIIAFLGRYSGNFTVKLDNGIQSELTMSDNKDFTEGTGTTYLRATGLQYPKPITVDTIPSDTGDLSLDLDKGGSKNSSLYFTKSRKPITLLTEDQADLANETDAMLWTTSLPEDYVQTDLYFAFTFFVKNPSFDSASPYMVSMTLDSETLPTDSTAPSLSSIMRVRCYENLVSEEEADITHNYATYAKALTTPVTNTDGTLEYREHVSGTNKKSPYYSEWCQNFYADNTVFSSIKTLEANTTMRYTVLLWLEGYDVDCKGSSDMSGSSISFSMHFYGQENGTTSSSSSNS
jgi:hypothetical protein